MNFTLEKSIEILGKTPSILNSFLTNLSDDWLRANEGNDTWSPYDIIGHLIHGEKTDWMVRIKVILSDSRNKNFKPYDRFAQMNNDQTTGIRELLSEFTALRFSNVQELKSLTVTDFDLTKKGIHPAFDEVTLEQLISTWVVHDLGHIAQISRVMAKQYRMEVGPFAEYLGILKN